MKKFLTLNIFFLMFSLTFSEPLKNNNPWKYSRTLSGIKIFHRDGVTDGLFEFLAMTTISVPADTLYKTVLDIPSNRYWMADCIHSEYLAKINSTEIIAYYITAPPWPVSKRDTVIRIKTGKTSGIKTFTLSALPEGEAEKYKSRNSNYVRIYRMEGTVTIEDTAQGLTEVKFSVAGESGGSVPGFIVKMGGWTIPYKTLSGLKKYTGSSF